MIELYQFPWSPFCIVQRRILEYSGAPFKIIPISVVDRSRVWRLTRQRYYGLPIIRDGRNVVFETSHNSQVIAKYLDSRLGLNLFPPAFAGIDEILWRHIENDVEDLCFRLNDVYWTEFVPKADQLGQLRYKERKFGVGCLDLWREQQPQLLQKLEQVLVPYETALEAHPFLLGDKPHFIDFDLYGMLSNFLYSGHYQLPAAHTRLGEWHQRVHTSAFLKQSSEKLRS
jgi:glutathione S-transferase